jgi:hypothetical protein
MEAPEAQQGKTVHQCHSIAFVMSFRLSKPQPGIHVYISTFRRQTILVHGELKIEVMDR